MLQEATLTPAKMPATLRDSKRLKRMHRSAYEEKMDEKKEEDGVEEASTTSIRSEGEDFSRWACASNMSAWKQEVKVHFHDALEFKMDADTMSPIQDVWSR